MKKTFSTILMTMTVCAFADPTVEAQANLPAPQQTLVQVPQAAPQQQILASSQPAPALLSENLNSKDEGYFYVRFAIAESDLARAHSVLPGLALGYRRVVGDGAVDISINGVGTAEHRNERFFWTLPKASYLHYFAPDEESSPYIGAGVAWGGVQSRHGRQHFIGIIPSFTAGMEYGRKKSFLAFSEFTFSQPTVSVSERGYFPGPCIELSTGVGF